MSAYWFYKQQMYDSAEVILKIHCQLLKTYRIKPEGNTCLRSFLKLPTSRKMHPNIMTKQSKHTTDPLMDIYANLNKAKMLKSNDPAEIDKSIAALSAYGKKR